MPEIIPDQDRVRIEEALTEVEGEHGVRILFALESGSRAWGFPSPDSDFDVRFIYAHPQEQYLSLNGPARDVIELPISEDLDVNGWDLRKALRLFSKSNPGFLEWIQSPIVYRMSGVFHERALALLPEVYSSAAGQYHYISAAKTTSQLLRGESVPLKKYFYALRPLFAALWIERTHKPPPIEFEKLRAVGPQHAEFRDAIDELLLQKSQTAELGKGPRVAVLDEFISSELERWEAESVRPSEPVPSLPQLDALFREILSETSQG